MLSGAELIHANMMWLGPIEFTAEEQDFARQIQRATDVPTIGLKGDPEPLDLDPREIEGGSEVSTIRSARPPTARRPSA